VSDEQREVLNRIHEVYDMNQHTFSGAPQTGQLTPEFASRFAILGPTGECLERLRELIELGLDHVLVIGPSLGSDRDEAAGAVTRFEQEVLPGLHELG
jgi:alkanesulfonate monooxygenase SsuD/methylene tetrahydromethanopterin reductase-like flavin-dependent oxidoreductase (luciferase family)